MIPLNPWEHQNAIKALYSKCVERVCEKHNITRMELDILLFLANNPCFDTATDIIEVRYLSKSQVSSSIKLLEQCGYLRKEYLECNRKTAHLRICEAAMDIIRDGQAAQEKFISIMLDGFSQEEIDSLRQYNDQILRNISACLKGKETE
ncbi:MAG: MarR family transcriptional regulator [Lachnospiraceae bacterium]|nr:MarR family transcriptional regulator [Lachnospiraceae bacterium]